MHEILDDAANFIEDEKYFGREAFNQAMTLIDQANADVNRRILKGTIDSFDIPRINKDIEWLKDRVKGRLHAAKMRMREREAKVKRKASTAGITFQQLKAKQ